MPKKQAKQAIEQDSISEPISEPVTEQQPLEGEFIQAEKEPEPTISKELEDIVLDSSDWSDETPPSEPKSPKAKKSDSEAEAEKLESAKRSAMGSVLTVATIMQAFGKEPHVNQDAAEEWAEGVAPAMVKYNLVPTIGKEWKWAAEYEAAKATAVLVAGIFFAVKASKEQPTAAQEPEKPAEAVTGGN